jgi:hypothetical protein
MIGGVGIGFGTVDSISDSPVGGGVITTLLRSADGSRPGLAENSRYFFLQMDEWTAEAGRSVRDQL